MVTIRIKWNKENYDNVEFDASMGVDGLKAIIYSLTHVPIERQKLMAKGVWTGTLKDDFDFTNCIGLKDGIIVLVMGTAEVIATPIQPITFLEDMSVEQKALIGATGPAGLVNLGNTCYLNSVLQSFRYLPALRDALTDPTIHGLIASLRDLFNQLDRSSSGVPPTMFLQSLRRDYPVFGGLSRDGRPLQQDAEEAFGALMTSMKNALPSKIHDIFEIEIEEQLHCSESTEEPVVVKSDVVNKLVCNIRGGSGAVLTVDHMIEGLRLGLEDNVEKHSLLLQRNAIWMKKQRLASLPKYLCIQFMRFFWKPTPESTDHTGVKCKIMRAVSFPTSLDVYELCSSSLQQKLSIQRKIVADANAPSFVSSSSASASAGSDAMEVTETTTVSTPSTPLETGLYDLKCIVTHKGRSADSGHYMSYVKITNPKNSQVQEWYKFDDAIVTLVSEEEVMRLCGGGDRDMAYFCMYARR